MVVDQGNIIRPDGRSMMQLRPVCCKFSQISTCSGSARFGFGDNEVLCMVYGPSEPRYKDELIDRAFLETVYKTPKGYLSPRDKMNERIIQELLKDIIIDTTLPRTSIKLVVQPLQENNLSLAIAINAAILALVDAGIPIKSLVASVTCIFNENGEIILDPIDKEIESARSVHIFAFEETSGNQVANFSIGMFSESDFFFSYEVCKNACSSLFSLYRQTILNKVKWDLL